MRRAVIVVALALTTAAHAEVTDRSPAGFELRHEATIAAAPEQVYATLLTPARWWNGSHTYSGDAANLSIDVAAGCFCERLPKGIVRHMTVIYSDGLRLVLEGALGPLASTGATGHLAVELTGAGTGTKVVLTYAVGGYAKGGLAERWAAPVDGVLGEQLVRLKRAVETGK
jgi:uncharacterized protein YndB with AHSA1/START domain